MGKKKRKNKSEFSQLQKSSNAPVFMAAGVLLGMVFLPTTLLLLVAMIPTAVVLLTDRSKRKTKAITVGAMNVAGTLPFILELWAHGHSFEKSFGIVTDLKAMIIIYAAAAVGYLIDWAMTGIVAGILVQRGHARMKAIRKRQKALVERWGAEVRGDIALDQYGFKIEASKHSNQAGDMGEGVSKA